MATPLTESAALGLAMRFDVVVTGFDLGSWATCKGLAVRFRHERVKELGEHGFITHLPGRAEYTKVTLQRAMVNGDWDKTKAWLADVAEADWMIQFGDSAGNALTAGNRSSKPTTITLRDAHNETVAEWNLINALPIGWKGPQLDAVGKKVALETLELIHEGFLA